MKLFKYIALRVKKYLNAFLHLFYPKICLHCGSTDIIKFQVLCPNCHAQLPFTDFFEIENNNVDKIFWGRLAAGPSGAVLFFTKNSIVQLLLFELKYKQNKRAGLLLGNMIGWALKKASRFNKIDFLIPIPVRKITERTRGYNQSLLLCEGIAQVFPIPILPTVLFKNKKTNTQTRKDRIERGHNTTLLFGLKNTDQIYNKHLLLVDDIITTGATAESAGRCLLQAKPASIQFAAAAYTLS
ncbi:MAG: ComF family protein [Chitinophagia bacterium]|jgi:ComF family protein|nr:ComF family protein [Chitinophagia bacterium]